MARTHADRAASDAVRRLHTDDLYRRLGEESDPSRRRDLVNEVVVLYLPVSRSIARGFRGRGCATEDLEQAAAMALVRAARDFDPGLGYPFLSYAGPCIRGSVKKHFRDFGWTVRPPRMVQELQQRIERATQTVDPVTGATPTVGRLAMTLDVDERDVNEALQARGCFTPVSLDAGVDGSATAVLGDLVADGDEALMDAVDSRAVLRPALSRIDEADRSVLAMRFVEGCSQKEMAERLGTSQPAVSRALARILGDLRAALTGHSPSSAAV